VAATWQTVSGNKFDGSMYAGPAAQRNMVVKAMQSAITASVEIREEQFAFNIICAPGYPELIDEMVSLNNDRANTAFVIGDTPMHLAPNAVNLTNWSNNSDGYGLSTADPYLGVYYPSAVSSDVRGNTVVVPPSHVMLRTFIRNDSVSFPWFAPAGVRRGLVDNATDIGYINADTGEFVRNGVSQGLRDAMYQQKINPITILPGVGLVTWGQKTRNPVASSMDRVNVARLVNYIRTILSKVGNAFLFEPNDKITRDQIKRIIEGAMNDLVAKRGIYDFLVVCDTSNNTPSRIAGNELYVDIAIEPMKDVEFIYIPIRLLNPGSIAAGQLGG
jgi:phage tail sheath protein FI